MTTDIVVIAPEKTPGAGGVADYTLRLLEYFPDRYQVSLLVPPLDLNRLPTEGGKLLVQYSAYGFDYLGYPRDLIRALIDWKRKTHGLLVVMFHEIWTFWPVTNKNYFVQLLHRRAIKQLLQHCDISFTSTAGQAEHLRVLNPKASVQILPVGSNIRRATDEVAAREPGTAILFGLQRARVRALQQMEPSLRTLASSGLITKLITVGSNSGAASDQEEFELLSSFQFSRGFEQKGAQPEAAISRLLSSASFGIFGQNESSYTKSGTFMAYAAHELNVLADSAGPTKPGPFCWLVAPRELIEGISRSELLIRAQRLRDWQERTCSWKLIAAKVAEALELGLAGHSTIDVARR